MLRNQHVESNWGCGRASSRSVRPQRARVARSAQHGTAPGSDSGGGGGHLALHSRLAEVTATGCGAWDWDPAAAARTFAAAAAADSIIHCMASGARGGGSGAPAAPDAVPCQRFSWDDLL